MGGPTGSSLARTLREHAAFFADHGVRIERVLTDNAKAHAESVLFAETAAGLGIRRKRTRRYRPQTNGMVERFNNTLLDEWAYAGCTALTPNAAAPSLDGCGSIITGDPYRTRRAHAHGGSRQQRRWEPQLDRETACPGGPAVPPGATSGSGHVTDARR